MLASWPAYPAETKEAFCDGHVKAFSFFGGVPRSILYDNTIAVARILGDRTRQRTQVFNELQSHYLFEDRFGRPGKGNDKGKVEGLVGYARRNFLVPIPVFDSFEALNAHLEACCRRRMSDRLALCRDDRRAARADLAALHQPLPPPYDACEKVPATVSSLSLVRYRRNDYSVPTSFGHREVIVRGYVHEVVIACGTEVIARHPRSYEREDFVFDPLHYLALIEQKINALDQAAPAGRLATAGGVRNVAPAAGSAHGQARQARVRAGAAPDGGVPDRGGHRSHRDAIARGAIGFDAVKHLVLCRIERRPPRLDMTDLPVSAQGDGGDDVGQIVHGPAGGSTVMNDTPQVLLAHHLKALKLPTFLREYDKVARQCAAEGVIPFLLRLAEQELIDRERRMVERRIKAASSRP